MERMDELRDEGGCTDGWVQMQVVVCGAADGGECSSWLDTRRWADDGPGDEWEMQEGV